MRLVPVLIACVSLLCPPRAAEAQNAPLVIAPDYYPNFVGIGIARVPDYFGSDDTYTGAAPGVRLSWGRRHVDVLANFVSVNLLNHRDWQFGPAGLYRFGRETVADDVINALPTIDGTVELGVQGGYVIRPSEDFRDRLRIGGNITYDVNGVHDGYTIGMSVSRWLPAFKYSAIGLVLGATYASASYMDTYFSVTPEGSAASGLPVHTAGAGVRDVRAMAVFVQPLSKKHFVGAGILYDRLLGDAADSPIVSDRGTPHQVTFGIGAGMVF